MNPISFIKRFFGKFVKRGQHPGFWTITIQFDLSMLAVKTVPEIRKMVHDEMKYVTEQALYCLEEIKAEGREHERASTPNEAS